MMILQLAAILSRGDKLPCDDTEREPIRIIYQTAEDGLGDTIKPRLLAANADCTQIKVIDESEAALSMLDERIEQAIIETGAKVIILDPVQAYIGSQIDMNRANEVRNVLLAVRTGSRKHGCAVILVGHLNKVQGAKAKSKLQARGNFIVGGRLKENKEVRVVAHEKSSLAPEGDPIAFEPSKETGFVWKGHYDISIDDLLNGISREKKIRTSRKLIMDCLSDGKYQQQLILKKAQNIGISKRVLDEAKNLSALSQ